MDLTFGAFFMTKYDERFRLQVVREYLDGELGVKSLGKRHGIGHRVIERWVASYREHGEAGLTKKFSHYDAQFKLRVLQRMWREELSYGQVAALFDIRSPGQVIASGSPDASARRNAETPALFRRHRGFELTA
jgi:transposase